jgi:DNA-binding MarR family transcriptional regulator
MEEWRAVMKQDIWVLKLRTWTKLNSIDKRLTAAMTCDITDVIACIGFHSRMTTAEINSHPYFGNTSLSTIKRFVSRLLNAGLIKTSNNIDDKREKILSINDR